MLLDKSIVIHAPPERVFEWLTPERMPQWDRSLVRAMAKGGGPLARGSHFDRVGRELGLRFSMDAEAVAVEPGRMFAWRQTRGDYERHRGAFTLEPAPGGGTRVRLVADVELPYVLPRLVTEDELRRELSRGADDALFNLKAMVERRQGGS